MWTRYSVLSLLFTVTVELEATKHKPVRVFGWEAKAVCSKLINNPKVGSKHPLKHVCLSQRCMLNSEGRTINICCFHIRVSLPVVSEGWHFNAIYIFLDSSFVSVCEHTTSPVYCCNVVLCLSLKFKTHLKASSLFCVFRHTHSGLGWALCSPSCMWFLHFSFTL